MIEILKQEDLCKDIAERWKAQYPENREVMGAWTDDVLHKLEALEGHGSPEQIAEAIGNPSWTILGCSLCRAQVSKVVLFDYDSCTVYLCEGCVNNMKGLFDGDIVHRETK